MIFRHGYERIDWNSRYNILFAKVYRTIELVLSLWQENLFWLSFFVLLFFCLKINIHFASVFSEIIRCICALVIGVLLVAWPEAAILYLVITIGVLFLVPGLFSLSGYLIRGKQDGSRFPIAGLGSLLFGLWLMIMPAFFVGILMYVLGAVLVLAGISQIVNLSAARSWTVVPGGFFVIPVLVLIAGIVVLFNPFTAAAVPFIILGVSSIVYGLSDLINIIRFRQKKEPGMPEIEDITPIEEIKD